MNFPKLQGLWILILLAGLSALRSADGAPDTQWFRDAKFGIFIHWGLYSGLGNEWNGKSYYGSGEWLMNRAKIPAAAYAQTATAFNPTNFNAADWARFVKESGARYLVITPSTMKGLRCLTPKHRRSTSWPRRLMKTNTLPNSETQAHIQQLKLGVALARGFGVDWWRLCTGQTTPEKLGLLMGN